MEPRLKASSHQLANLPADTSHLIVSVGGNDALDHCPVLRDEPAKSFAEVLTYLADVHARFQQEYRRMLQRVLAFDRPTAVCTIYDAIPDLHRAESMGLCIFNDVIVREAYRVGIPVIDMRLICTEPGDFSPLSPIEPSMAGGAKIATAVIGLLMRS